MPNIVSLDALKKAGEGQAQGRGGGNEYYAGGAGGNAGGR